MNSYAFILGSNPELSIEELLSVLKSMGSIKEVNQSFLIFHGDIDPRALLPRIGGTIKIAKIIDTFTTANAFTEDLWLHLLRSELHDANGRFTFGVSVYAAQKSLREHLHRRGLALKKRLKLLQLSPRFVYHDSGILSSVVVQKNKLLGRELVVCEGSQYYFGLTQAVQDFESYGLRDYGRPARNTMRGMLPPKLAQIMLNLAQCSKDSRLLDPFCGGGTILQEALLMGIRKVFGSDKDPEAIAEAEKNFQWLGSTYNTVKPMLAIHDASSVEQRYPSDFFDVVVTEPYLGPARLLMSKSLVRSALKQIVSELDVQYAKMFQHLHPIVRESGRLVVLFPIFKLFGTDHYVGNLKAIEKMGYRRIMPSVVSIDPEARLSERGNLVYAREDQVVNREITVWAKTKS